MANIVLNFADERLIRRAPEYALALDTCDEAYLRNCLAGIDDAFALPPDQWALPGAPLCFIPARTLMRRLVTLRRNLVPATPEQRLAHGRLWSAIGLLHTAIAMAEERAAAHDASQQHR